MNPDDITLINTSQQFEYEKFAREIDVCGRQRGFSAKAQRSDWTLCHKPWV